MDLGPEQSHHLNLALNRISGDWDEQLLARMLADLQANAVDLEVSGFDADEINRLLKGLEASDKRDRLETFDLDAALADAEARPVTQPGDLWLLGDHRCSVVTRRTQRTWTASSTARRQRSWRRTRRTWRTTPAASTRRRGPTKARRTATRTGTNTGIPTPASSFSLASYARFLARFLKEGLKHLAPKSAVYQWHATRRQALVEQAWVECGLLVHQTIVWVKARGVLTRSHYLWSHEPCFYGWVEGSPPKLKPPASERTVWHIDQVGEQSGYHPTQKPVELFLRPIEFHTRPGVIVYEPFSGSGTQITAAERTGRLCYAMEQEPRYVQVAVARWEAFSGKKATRG